METQELKTVYMNNLKALKDTLRMTIPEMAEKMQVSKNTLASYIRGDRVTSLEIATQLYTSFNVNLNWFCTGKGEMFNTAPSNTSINQDEILKVVEEFMEQRFKEKGL